MRAPRVAPKAREERLLVEHVGDETVVYDLETKNAHCLAPLAAAVFALCDGARTLEEMASAAHQRLGRPVTPDDVAGAVTQLEECRLLDVPVVVDHGLSRREALGKVAFAGATAAFAGSLITTIAAPSALAAASPGLPPGCSCTRNNQCASNHCCSGVGQDKCNAGCCADNNGVACRCSNGVCPSPPTPPATCGACTPSGGSAC